MTEEGGGWISTNQAPSTPTTEENNVEGAGWGGASSSRRSPPLPRTAQCTSSWIHLSVEIKLNQESCLTSLPLCLASLERREKSLTAVVG